MICGFSCSLHIHPYCPKRHIQVASIGIYDSEYVTYQAIDGWGLPILAYVVFFSNWASIGSTQPLTWTCQTTIFSLNDRENVGVKQLHHVPYDFRNEAFLPWLNTRTKGGQWLLLGYDLGKKYGNGKWTIWGFPKMVVPPKHPKMIIFSRKIHGCWVPPFLETTIWTIWFFLKMYFLVRKVKFNYWSLVCV